MISDFSGGNNSEKASIYIFGNYDIFSYGL